MVLSGEIEHILGFVYSNFYLKFVFAATAATIVSGAIAERCQFFAYFAYSIIITGWVSSLSAHHYLTVLNAHNCQIAPKG